MPCLGAGYIFVFVARVALHHLPHCKPASRESCQTDDMRSGCVLICLLALPCAAQTPPAVPDNLKPPAGTILLLQVHATGDQIYTCDGEQWVFSRPDARLFDDSGKPVGLHFAGPTWEYADHSRVMGKAVASAAPDPMSIPWLLLQATDHQGEGRMQRVTSIQRIATKGGKAPASGCDVPHKGQEARSRYTAEYLFYAGS